MLLLGLVIGLLTIPAGVGTIIGVSWLYEVIKKSGVFQILWYKGLWYHCSSCRRLGCTLKGCRILYWQVLPLKDRQRQWPLYCRPCATRKLVYYNAARKAQFEQSRLTWLWRGEAAQGIELSECYE